MEKQIQESSGETIISPPMIDSFWKRLLFGAFVIAAPIFNFSFVHQLGPEWQSGKFSDHVYMFLLPEASLWSFPLLLYSVVSYILLLNDEYRFGKSFIVRLGVYTGTLLALQYSLLTLMTWEVSFISIVLLIAWVFPILVSVAKDRIRLNWNLSFLLFLFMITVFVIYIILGLMTHSAGIPFLLIIFLLAISAPFWSFLISLQAARWLWAHHESKLTLPRRLGIFAWVSTYVFALRFNILKMFELYAALPTEPPNCYIATAAAYGHSRFVGSQTVQLKNGKSMQVNRQLQKLKAVEIALMGVSGTGHRMMRRIYDVIGKKLAAHIQNPLLADVAYLLLIPIEWISFFVLKLVVPEIKNVSERLYRS